MSWARFCKRVISLLAAALIVFVATAGPASAHTNLVSTDPADGSVLTQGPPSVTLNFSERVSLDLVELKLTNAAGSPLPLPAPTLTPERHGLVVVLPSLASDAYRLTYNVRDPVDLHLTSGAVVFAVGHAAVAAGGQAEQPVPPLQALFRWLARYSLAVALGAASVYAYHLRRVGERSTRQRLGHRALTMVVAGAAVVAVAESAALLNDVVDIGGSWPTTAWRVLRSSVYGHRYLVTLQLIVGVIALSRIARRLPVVEGRHRPSVFEVGPAVLLLGVAVTAGFATHSATGGSFAAGVVLRVVHLASFGVWAGGLVAILLVARGPDKIERLPLLRSFSPVALGAVALTIASGLAMTGREVASLTALFSTHFGTILLVKVGVLVVGLVFAARHRRALARGRVPGGRGLALEATLLALVVVAGAVLASGEPAVGVRFDPPQAASPSTQTVQVADLLVKFSLRPNRPGRNLLDVAVMETRRPSLGVIEDVSVTVTAPDGQTFQRHNRPAADGTVALDPVDLTSPGPVTADVSVNRPSAPVGVAHFALKVDRIPVPRAPTVVSNRSLEPYVAGGAMAVLTLAGMVLLISRRRSRRRLQAAAIDPLATGLVGADAPPEPVLVDAGR